MVVMIQFVALSVFKSNTQKERGKLLKGFLSHVLQSKIKVKHPAETPGNAVTAETATLSDFSQCDQTSASSTCAWSVILELSAFSREKVFPSSLWFIQYLANLALNLPHEISSHFSPPLPAYVNYSLLNLVPSQHASSPSAFATAPLGEWETGPSKEARVHSRHSASALPTQCGSPTDHNVRPYRECTGGHLWFAGIQMNVYGACLAAKGQALSQLLQPLSWVRSWLCGLALNWVKICGVWICDLLISLYVTTPVYYSPGNEVTVFVYVFSACLFYRNSKNHSVHLSVKWQPQFTCVVCVLAGFTIFNI